MDPVIKAIVFAVALCLFVVEGVRHRSLLCAGLAVFTVPFLWDAIDAA
jgi:hypothetical protein